MGIASLFAKKIWTVASVVKEKLKTGDSEKCFGEGRGERLIKV